MKTTNKILIIVSLMIIQACGQELPVGAVSASYDQPFTLAYGQTAVTADSLQIKLIDVPSDSRCASGAVCVWAGEVILELAVKQGPAIETARLTLSPGQAEPTRDTLSWVIIELTEVFPYPDLKVNYGSIDINDYQIDMTIRKL